MKKIVIPFIISTLIVLASCHKDLEVVHKSGLTTSNMWTEAADAIAARNGMYRQFRATFITQYPFWGEYRTGIWGPGNDGSEGYRDEIYDNTIQVSNGSTNWAALYSTIGNANFILKYTPGLEMNQDQKNSIIADALFIRSFCYYWIVRLWGDAPLVLQPYESANQDNLFPSREPQDRIFDQIDEDIERALSIIPDNHFVADRNMATKTVLNVFKADFNLWSAKVRGKGKPALDKAKSALDDIKKVTSYQLENNFSTIFQSKSSSEIIFTISLLRNEAEGGYSDVFLESISNVSPALFENPVKVGSVRQRCFLTPQFQNFLLSESKDTRTKTTFDTYYDVDRKRKQQWVNKFAGTWEQGTRIFDSNIPIYRYADVLLLSAEVYNALGDPTTALAELNKVAKRAYGVDQYYPTSLSPQDIDSKILDERMKEFVAEGKLWWDYIRMGQVFKRTPSLIGRDNEKNILLWPISNSSINSNPNIKPNEFDY